MYYVIDFSPIVKYQVRCVVFVQCIVWVVFLYVCLSGKYCRIGLFEWGVVMRSFGRDIVADGRAGVVFLLALIYLVYLFSALVFPVVAKGAALFLLVLGVFALYPYRGGLYSLSFEEELLLFAFGLFAIVSITSFFYWPQSRESQMRLEDYGTFLLLIPLYLLLRQYQFDFKHLVGVLALVAIFLGLVSVAQYVSMAYFGELFLVGEGRMSRFWLRPSGGVNPMRYAAISLIFACFALNALLLIRNKTLWLKGLLVIAVILALVACLLAQVRGSWLALPVLLVAYGFYLFKSGHPRFMLGVLLGGVLLFGVVTQLQVVQQRYDHAVSNVSAYINGNAQTSLGARFDMFKAAGILIAERPLWGHGLNSYSPKASEIREATPGMSHEVGMWNNPHNEILQVMVEKGVVGLITLILLFVAPGYMFIKALYDRRVEVKYYGMSGLAILIVYAVAGQSVALFEHDVFNHFFALMILLFASQISVLQRLGGRSG